MENEDYWTFPKKTKKNQEVECYILTSIVIILHPETDFCNGSQFKLQVLQNHLVNSGQNMFMGESSIWRKSFYLCEIYTDDIKIDGFSPSKMACPKMNLRWDISSILAVLRSF